MARRPLSAIWTLLVVGALAAGGAGVAALRTPMAADATPDASRDASPDTAAVVASPHAGPAPSAAGAVATAAPSPLPATRAALSRMLATRIADSPVADVVGVAVVDEHGHQVADHRAAISLLPASTMKLVTAAAVLETLGPNHRFVTSVAAAAPPTPGGTIVGDLWMLGGGDPVLATDAYRRFIYPVRPRTELEQLADAVVASGVRRVLGGVVGVPGWQHEPLARGWSEHYLSDLDARRITGLTVDAGLDWRLVAVEPQVEVELHPSRDPIATAARELTRLLVERGVTVEHGGRALGDDAATAEDVGSGTGLAQVASPAVIDLLRHTVERSDNQLADTLFRAVGAAAGDPSWSGAGRAVVDALDQLGVTTAGLALADGSGLSRLDRVPASTLATLDRAMAAGPHAAHWTDLMAVAGVEGTLRRRLAGTVAEGRLLGKTGTLDDVVALAGSVHGPGTRRYHFAVIANLPPGASRWDARVVADDVVLLLAQDLWCGGPVLVPAPEGSGDGTTATVPAPVCPS